MSITFPKLYLIVKLHTKFEDGTTVFSNIKVKKRDFLSPMNLDGT